MPREEEWFFTHGFIMRFSDEAHMRAYFETPNPDHQTVSEELHRICSYMAFDIPYWDDGVDHEIV